MDAAELIKALQSIGYRVMRQSGSHIRLQTEQPKPHAVTVPKHSLLKLGTLSAILSDVAQQRDMSKDALLRLLFGK
ncbi:MAG: type II toxin-antitoxin system HicA family toxin [Gammaproteobacteria bacterium]